MLDALRFVQGAACGCIWGGGLAWVIAIAPRERRGEVLGSVLAAAIFGTLLGPVLGTLAVAVGTEFVFSCVGAVSLGLAAWTLRHREPPLPEAGTGAPLLALVRSPRLMLGLWLVAARGGHDRGHLDAAAAAPVRVSEPRASRSASRFCSHRC